MKTNRSTRRGLPAFTLIELILGVGIMAIVMIAINAVFFSSMRLRERTAATVDESLPIERTLAILRRDLQGAMAPSEEGILSGDFRVGDVTSIGVGQPVDIELYTTTGVLRENEPWGEVQKVAYQLRLPGNRGTPGQDLIRSVTRNLLATMTPQPEEQWMMGGVENILFSCYDGTAWQDTWDSAITTNLPAAVRVRILLANPRGSTDTPRAVEMVVPIDSQSRTNQNASVSGS
jgi:type II secretion system protein J